MALGCSIIKSHSNPHAQKTNRYFGRKAFSNTPVNKGVGKVQFATNFIKEEKWYDRVIKLIMALIIVCILLAAYFSFSYYESEQIRKTKIESIKTELVGSQNS